MEVRNSNFAAFIDIFTSNTYVMVVMSDPSIRKFQRAKPGRDSVWVSQAWPPKLLYVPGWLRSFAVL